MTIAEPPVGVEELLLDRGGHSLTGPDGRRILLTAPEFAALETLTMEKGRLVSRDELSIKALGRHWSSKDRGIDQIIVGLRQKLPPDVDGQSLIESIRGGGYQLRTVRLPSNVDITVIAPPGTGTENSDQHRAESRFQGQIVLTELTLEGFDDGYCIADLGLADLPLIYVNKAFEHMTGYDRSELLGRNCRFLQGGERRQQEISALRNAIAAHAPAQVTLKNFKKDGTPYWAEVRLRPILDTGGIATHYLGAVRDVSFNHEIAERTAFLATHDESTGLLNRRGFMETIEATLSRAKAGLLILLACVDLDRLRDVNHTHGRLAGDAVLAACSQRLTEVQNCIAAKRGDGHFYIAIDAASGEADAVARLRDCLLAPYSPPGFTVAVTASIGYVASYVESTAEKPATKRIEEMMDQATSAAYDAKRTGPGGIHTFDNVAQRANRRRLQLTTELRNALRENELVLFYQPKVNLASGTIVGAEALLRWRHPVFGLQAPGTFLQVAEESGLIVDIGRWAMHEAAKFAVELNRNSSRVLSIAVNVSEVQVRRSDVPKTVEEALYATGARPQWFSVELTESVLADTECRTRDALLRLSSLGIELAADDFGTGYSSLSYMRDLPFSCVKIDRSFVKGVDIQPRAAALAEAIVRMAVACGLTVVAEGVETEQEANALVKMGCWGAQGYYFSKPLEQEDFVGLLGQNQPLPLGRALSLGEPNRTT